MILWIKSVSPIVESCFQFNVEINFSFITEYMSKPSQAKELNWRSNEYAFNDVVLFPCKLVFPYSTFINDEQSQYIYIS